MREHPAAHSHSCSSTFPKHSFLSTTELFCYSPLPCFGCQIPPDCLPRHQLQSCTLDFLIKGGNIKWFHVDSKGDFPRGIISSPYEGCCIPQDCPWIAHCLLQQGTKAAESEKPLHIFSHLLTYITADLGYLKPFWSYLHGLHLRGVDHRGGLSCLNDSLDLDLLSRKLNDCEGSRTSERHLQQTKNHQ